MASEITLTLPSNKPYSQPLGMFVNNEFVPPSCGTEVQQIINPATGELIMDLTVCDEEDVNFAVKAAKEAFSAWKKVHPFEKRDLFLKLADLVARDREILAEIESLCTGQPVFLSGFNVDSLVQSLRYAGGWIDKLSGNSFDPSADCFTYILRQPLGVVGCIIPFNFPLMISGYKIAAIAAGNTAVFKPADNTPFSLLHFAKLVVEAGFPPGVFNIVLGTGHKVGNALVVHPDVSKIAFTGSTRAGREISKCAADSLKPLSLECGGKSAAAIFEDCDFQNAVKSIAMGIFYNAGQICCANSRCYVQSSIYDKFVKALNDYIKVNCIVGPPSDPKATIGPLITANQRDKLVAMISDAKARGVTILSEADTIANNTVGNGFYLNPTILGNVKDDDPLSREELFGPILIVSPFETYKEVISRCNDSQYALGSFVYTSNLRTALRFTADVEAGVCWVNETCSERIHIPFGGPKLTGSGEELGPYVLMHFTYPKSISMNFGAHAVRD